VVTKIPGPYRAQFGAVHHEEMTGFLFTFPSQATAAQVAEGLNAAMLLPDLVAAARRAVEEAVADDLDPWFADLKAALAKAGVVR
jgi:hypothetical protein